ncbi:helix-turn-helix domain-containing protein [Nocardia neocaledoniensis]|uniref:helix-turn-helix domain-containing protein n=1 Tax=Nocardia neocaledoniensis TaxID=236511 RepID=UPI002456622D|nr:helix-turn-helix transcriptional regulator [Nocardia neocaledoniensis]
MRYEEAIGTRVAVAREAAGITQGELGKRVAEWLGGEWSRQAVWAAERGKRSFTAVELVTLARVLNVAPDWLMTPPLEVTEVEMPSGVVVPRSELTEATLPASDLGQILHDREETLAGLLQKLTGAMNDVADLASRDAEVREHIQKGGE